MPVVGRGDGHGVDVVTVENAARISDCFHVRASFGEARDFAIEHVSVDVTHRDEPYVRQRPQCVHEILSAAAYADHGATHLLSRAPRRTSVRTPQG